MNRQQETLRGLAGGMFLGMFLIGLAFAVFLGLGHYFLSLLFLGLACSSLLGMMSTFDPKKIYGGLQGFVWCLGLAILFLPQVSFWPGILLVCGISAIVGALAKPIIAGIGSMDIMSEAARPKPQAHPTDQQPYQAYEQGYQSPQQTPEVYQEGGAIYDQPPQPQQPFSEQPLVQYPQHEETPAQRQ